MKEKKCCNTCRYNKTDCDDWEPIKNTTTLTTSEYANWRINENTKHLHNIYISLPHTIKSKPNPTKKPPREFYSATAGTAWRNAIEDKINEIIKYLMNFAK